MSCNARTAGTWVGQESKCQRSKLENRPRLYGGDSPPGSRAQSAVSMTGPWVHAAHPRALRTTTTSRLLALALISRPSSDAPAAMDTRNQMDPSGPLVLYALNVLYQREGEGKEGLTEYTAGTSPSNDTFASGYEQRQTGLAPILLHRDVAPVRGQRQRTGMCTRPCQETCARDVRSRDLILVFRPSVKLSHLICPPQIRAVE
ncbi:hypothetical protein B0H16DRAFT_1790355 [Mycena metata]|uniref:Uncharacterized protein n=1 Tax=Mycena metata TaxID=1033252 RepID=A0AAD7HJ09_9AGAR|nr:hypothetical protein B0H16DRAFT_1790355 [Mycena metata]